MRVLLVVLGLVAMPFMAGVSQALPGSNCDNGQGDEHRSAQGTAHAHRGVCTPQETGCAVTAPPSLGTTVISGRVSDFSTGLGLANWCVDLSGAVTATVATDASGNYSFTGLPGGTYTVCEVLQSGWSEAFPTSAFGVPCPTGFGWAFTLSAGSGASSVNFGNTPAL